MKVTINANTNGKGHWTEEERLVTIIRLEIGYSSLKYYPEDPFNGELRAYFEPSGFMLGSWNVPGHGLIYTDKLWMKEFKAGLRQLGLSIKAVQNVGYSEQGMQGDDYVSMDIGPTFYKSWLRLQAQLKKEADANAIALETTSNEV
jgi:hypothetical protein